MACLIPVLSDIDLFWWKFKTHNASLGEDVSLLYHLVREHRQSLVGVYFSHIKTLDNAMEVYAEITQSIAQHPTSFFEIIQFYPESQQAALLRDTIECCCIQEKPITLKHVKLKPLVEAINMKNNNGQTLIQSLQLSEDLTYRRNAKMILNAISRLHRKELTGAQYRFHAHEHPNLKRDLPDVNPDIRDVDDLTASEYLPSLTLHSR